jgi:acyl-CoA dehydrogenase
MTQSHTPVRERMLRICTDIAAPHAGSVDAEARFPKETFDALKRERLLSLQIPLELGGDGLGLGDIADLCRILGNHCASSAMIFAMHHIKLHNLVAGGRGSAWHELLMRRIVDEQLLLGSATTETGIGGDLRNSICAVERDGDHFRLTKAATVISYGRDADAIFVTARRAPDAASSDQVMVAFLKHQYHLEPTHTWDTLGMRGTCSEGFILKGEAGVAQIFPQSFAELAAQSMLAASHILWSSVWYGIAQDALGRAHAAVRSEARRKPGSLPPSATPLAEANVKLHQMRAVLLEAIDRFAEADGDADRLGSINFAVAMNNLKVSASRLASECVLEALRITGISGYRNDTPSSVGRHLRDVLSAPLMIANDRVVGHLGSAVLATKFQQTLAE